MQDYYVSRIVSSSYLRPGLLLGGAGLVLGAALVLFLAPDHGATARAAWPSPTEASTAAPTIELNRSAAAIPAAEPVGGYAATGQQLALLPKNNPADKQADLMPAQVAKLPGTALVPTYAASVGGPVRLVQHSWDTIKAMFR